MSQPITVTAAAALIGVAPITVRRACRRLGVARLGTAYMISSADLQRIRDTVRYTPGNPEFGSRAAAQAAARARWGT